MDDMLTKEWADNHHVMTDGIDRGLRRLLNLVRRSARKLAGMKGNDQSADRHQALGSDRFA
ncbi:hypothetical protein ACDP63_04550 [Paracoccus sp. P2]|uniref:hypothetical protein n=1 Tax=Paracoccus sp. P2 TaxID=3248840 RepID=UPI00391F5D6B